MKWTYVGIISIALCFGVMAQEKYNPVPNQAWRTNRAKHTVPLNEIKIVVGKDQIPPIYKPEFWSVKEASKTYFKHEPVISLEIDGEAKAYPLSVLMYHEIANDVINGIPIMATYCPLCNAAIVFDRRVEKNGKLQTLTFGVSGMLRNSDMVMWDHETESWWQQITGEGIVGQYSGTDLELIPSLLISFEQFTTSYPNGSVLSTNTGTFRNYGSNPYVNYDSSKPFLFTGEIDPRLPAMERVINVNIKGKDFIYPLSTIESERVINDNPNGTQVVLFFQKGVKSAMDKTEIRYSKDVGAVTVFSPILNDEILTFEVKDKVIKDIKTSSTWSITGKCISGTLIGKQLEPIIHGNHFAFAWLATKPESQIYQP